MLPTPPAPAPANAQSPVAPGGGGYGLVRCGTKIIGLPPHLNTPENLALIAKADAAYREGKITALGEAESSVLIGLLGDTETLKI